MSTSTSTTQVVTYQHAYITGRTSLCDTCHDDPGVLAALPSLGPVSHGYHYGHCDGCDIVRLSRAYGPARDD